MRSYLLGTLEPECAGLIEERYFTDRNFFLFMQAAETALIQDYLAGQLAPLPRRLFEERYLKVPDLRRRVEEVRLGSAAKVESDASNFNAQMLLAAAIVVFCICGLTLWMFRGRLALEPLPTTGVARPILATVALTPGITKAGSTETAQLVRTSAPGSFRFLLDIPGDPIPNFVFVRLSIFSPDGSARQIWSSGKPYWPERSPQGKQIMVLLESSLLTPGDFLIEVTGPDEQVRDSYLFRVARM
jgi:hypothetical protein